LSLARLTNKLNPEKNIFDGEKPAFQVILFGYSERNHLKNASIGKRRKRK